MAEGRGSLKVWKGADGRVGTVVGCESALGHWSCGSSVVRLGQGARQRGGDHEFGSVSCSVGSVQRPGSRGRDADPGSRATSVEMATAWAGRAAVRVVRVGPGGRAVRLGDGGRAGDAGVRLRDARGLGGRRGTSACLSGVRSLGAGDLGVRRVGPGVCAAAGNAVDGRLAGATGGPSRRGISGEPLGLPRRRTRAGPLGMVRPALVGGPGGGPGPRPVGSGGGVVRWRAARRGGPGRLDTDEP